MAESERVSVDAAQVEAEPAAGLGPSPAAAGIGPSPAPAAVDPGSLSTENLLALQRTAGNALVSRLLDREHDGAAARHLARQPKPDDKGSLEKRVSVLEKKTAQTELDLKWRATFGKRLSGYRETIYALTAGFETATKAFESAQTQQAQAEAMKDQVIGAILNVAAAGAAQPFLTAAFASMKNLDKLVEAIENPLVQAAQGATAVAQASSSQTATNTAMSGGDPLLYLSTNLKLVEEHNGKIEAAFEARSNKTASFTPDDWEKLDLAKEAEKYAEALAGLDAVLLADPKKLEAAPTLATKIELYYWAAWIKANSIPGVKGLQVGSKLASRMKAIGVESLADVRFDTTSWIFMDHKPPPPEFENRLVNFARGWSQKLVKA
jgi:hypothetical protein